MLSPSMYTWRPSRSDWTYSAPVYGRLRSAITSSGFICASSPTGALYIASAGGLANPDAQVAAGALLQQIPQSRQCEAHHEVEQCHGQQDVRGTAAGIGVANGHTGPQQLDKADDRCQR